VPGQVVTTPDAAAAAAVALGGHVVVKAQVLSGGRGKAGGVKLADTPDAAAAAAAEILGMEIGGYRTDRVLVVRAVDIADEFYAGFTLDRNARCLALIFSAAGGVEIETVAAETPEQILTLPVPDADALADPKLLPLLEQAVTEQATCTAIAGMVRNLYRLCRELDGSLVEINPLARLADGSIVAADAKLVLDDNGIPLHPELEALRNPEEYTADEIEAREADLSFVSLDGDIGCMVNGAGLAMATMDMIKLAGGSPANFLDVGGSSNPRKVLEAMRILLRNPKLKAILVNIFGGITRCDDIAEGIVQARDTLAINVPIVIRLIGTNEEAGHTRLREAGLTATAGMAEAIEAVVAAAAGRTAA